MHALTPVERTGPGGDCCASGAGNEFSKTMRKHLSRWIAFVAAILMGPLMELSAAIFTVTNNAASGPGTLLAAMLAANATPGPDQIHFNLPAASRTITPAAATPLPALTEAVVIDATTQPGYAGVPLVELSGANFAPLSGVNGLLIQAGGCVVRGLAINRWKLVGIQISGGSNNIVEGCWVGLALSGTLDAGNTFGGIFINSSPGNRIGGTMAAQRNVISGNDDSGILIRGIASVSNRVEGNFIGLNATGSNIIPNSADGISIEGAVSTLIGGEAAGAGNVISGNTRTGIRLGIAPVGIRDSPFAENTRILGNIIGLDPAGSVDRGNIEDGIYVGPAVGTVIGGTSPGARNVISGNNNDGIELAGGNEGSVIQGNIIGLDGSGTAARANSRHGVAISGGRGPQIGGTVPGAGNVISGNTQNGVYFHITGSAILSPSFVEGNRIGTDVSGTLDLGNVVDGIRVEFFSDVRIGGSALGAGNLISGNNGNGIQLTGLASTGWATDITVEGNRIGTDLTGTKALPNNSAGVFINALVNAPASGRIGGPSSAQANLIAFNLGDGVFVSGVTAGNSIRGNSIHSNGQLGIDLAGNGVTVNDATDADTGSNGVQNFPTLEDAVFEAALIRIAGTLQSTPNAMFTLDFYGNTTGDPSGHGEGEVRFGSQQVTTDADGFVRFAAAFSKTNGVTIPQRFVSATATDAAGSTSEFSGHRQASTSELPFSYRVVNTLDSGAGSLRQAILDANASRNEGDRIVFEIPGDGPHVISLLTALPPITGPLLVDGYTQTGAMPGTSAEGQNAVLKIVLDGASAPNGTDGLQVAGSRALIRGLVVQRFRGDGIEIMPNTIGVAVEGCLIGLGLDGSDQGQGGAGIRINAASENRIGGTQPGSRNVISGNSTHGIFIDGATARSNRIIGNLVGTDVTGRVRVGNSLDGVHVTAGSGNSIGGSGAGEGNLIGGNSGDGIDFENASRNVVFGNRIGIGPDGVDVRNNSQGVLVTSGTDNRIGGVQSGEGNVIAFNTGRGVGINNNAAHVRNAIRGNSLFANGNLGIDLGMNGRTANDAASDPDTGPNRLQNHPELTSAMAGPASTRIVGTLTTAFNAPFVLDFYASGAADPTGFGEGRQYLGSSEVSTGPTGTAGFEVDLPARVTGRFITATATDAEGNTSEFSAAIRATATLPPSTFTVTTTADDGPGSLRQALLDADTVVAGTAHRILFAIPGAGPQVIRPATALPMPVNEPVELDGFSQSGASANTLVGADNAVHRVVLDGSSLPSGQKILRFAVAGSGAKGLVVVGGRDAAIELVADGCWVEGCRVGLGLDGLPQPNSRGIVISGTATGCRVGGNAPAARNVIAGNNGNSVELRSSVGGNQVVGNFIGLTPDGAARPADSPIFSGSFVGVLVQDSPGNDVGLPGAGNTIAAHQSTGVVVQGAASTGNRIRGNRVGTDVSGALDLGNGADGISVQASNNRVGGTGPGEGNRVAFNTQNGVSVFGFPPPTGVSVRGNAIRDNDGLAIDLGLDGVGSNDPADADSGPNNQQNFPLLSDATATPTTVLVEGSIQSSPNQSFQIDLYANVACDASGSGEGGQYLGSVPVTTGADGIGVFDATFAVAIEGRFLTATATDANGNTSEMGPCLEAITEFGSDTFVVTTTADSGPGSLRAALLANNASVAGAPNRIEFAIPGAGPHRIQPASPLPSIQHAVHLDGFSQPGSRANTQVLGDDADLRIQIASGPGSGPTGLGLVAQDCTVSGISLTGWFQAVNISGDRAGIRGCRVGLAPDGTAAGNSVGVRVQSGSGHRIGGDVPAARNLIGGNGTPVDILAGSNVRVEGNHVGVGPGGAARPNTGPINVRGTGHRLGGEVSGAGNVISGNTAGGLFLTEATDCLVLGNRIGTDAAGLVALPNVGVGVEVSSTALGTRIGGPVAGEGNLISGNTGLAVRAAAAIVLLGNRIGVPSIGETPLPNAGGIDLTAPGSTVGGVGAGEANIIAYSPGAGVRIFGAGATGNRVRGNAIFGHGGLGLDLGADGPTANDPLDTDAGPNGFQNHPVLLSASLGSETVRVVGQLASRPSQVFQLDFHAGPQPEPGTPAQGRQYLGSAQVTTDAAGNAAFDVSLPAVAIGRWITAMATGPDGTSEFSAPIRADSTRPGLTFTVTNEADAGAGTLRQALIDAGSVVAGTPHRIVFVLPGAGVRTLTPMSALPVPAEPVLIDGFSQAGSTPNTDPSADNALRRVRIDGTSIAVGALLRLETRGSGVRGLILTGGRNAALDLAGEGGITVTGCEITGNGTGLWIQSPNNTVGGTLPAERNRIGGQSQGFGVFVFGGAGSGNRILGNLIGIAADGMAPDPNREGVHVAAASGLQIGDLSAGAGNRISFQTAGGVVVSGGSGVAIRGNRFSGNGGLSIDLGSAGVTPNDVGDTDAGPNGLQNFPVITSARLTPAGVRIVGTLNSIAGRTYALEAFHSKTCAAAGNGHAETFLGSASVPVLAGSVGTFDFTLPGRVPAGVITLTATDPDGNTSEFGACAALVSELPPETFVVTSPEDSGPGTLRQAIESANAAFSSGVNRIHFNLPGAGTRVIRPKAPLPPITQATVVDGTTQTGSVLDQSGKTLLHVLPVQLDGRDAGAGADGLVIRGDSITLRGLGLVRFRGFGVRVQDSKLARLEALLVGVNGPGQGSPSPQRKDPARGTSRPDPDEDGGLVLMEGGSETGNAGGIFGVNSDIDISICVLSGNGGDGLNCSRVTVNIAGCFFGMGPDGESDAGNGGHGIDTQQGSCRIVDSLLCYNDATGWMNHGDDIPSDSPLELSGSLVSDNGGTGIHWEGIPGAADRLIEGNDIGGNGGDGIHLCRVDFSVVRGNRIFGNDDLGIRLEAVFDSDIGQRFADGLPEHRNAIQDNAGGGIRILDILRTSVLGNLFGLSNPPENATAAPFNIAAPVVTPTPGGITVQGSIGSVPGGPGETVRVVPFVHVAEPLGTVEPLTEAIATIQTGPGGAYATTLPPIPNAAFVIVDTPWGPSPLVSVVGPLSISLEGPSSPIPEGQSGTLEIVVSNSGQVPTGGTVVIGSPWPIEPQDPNHPLQLASDVERGIHDIIDKLLGRFPLPWEVSSERQRVGASAGSFGPTIDAVLNSDERQRQEIFNAAFNLDPDADPRTVEEVGNSGLSPHEAVLRILNSSPDTDADVVGIVESTRALVTGDLGADVAKKVQLILADPGFSRASYLTGAVDLLLTPWWTGGPVRRDELPGGPASSLPFVYRLAVDSVPAGGSLSIKVAVRPSNPGSALVGAAVQGDNGFSPGRPVSEVLFALGPLDFGDAPDVAAASFAGFPPLPGGYPVLSAADGARHVVSREIGLGASTEAEPNGQPHPTALGDDGVIVVPVQVAIDDEDCVVFSAPKLVKAAILDVPDLGKAGDVVKFAVYVRRPLNRPVNLGMWMDFNRDGDWSDPGETLFNNRAVRPGVNMLKFRIPAGASGFTFARFRLAQREILQPTGLELEGEVEDHIVHLGPIDRGDAPAIYGDAPHAIPPNATHFLGVAIDADPVQHSPDASADDAVPPGDDEDGITSGLNVIAGTITTLRVTASQPGFLDIWIDYDRINGFVGGSDYVNPTVIGHAAGPLPVGAGINVIRFRAPARLIPGGSFLRLRFTKQNLANLGPTAFAPDGECEDYPVRLLLDVLPDLGDAPQDQDGAGYPTLLLLGGAFHLLEEGFHLGARIDIESDGFPGSDALGDDQDDGLESIVNPDPDDEDGVRFLDPIRPGQPLRLEVVASIVMPGPAFLNAWFDWNGDRDWNDAGEQVLQDAPVVVGTNLFVVTVPANAVPGTTFSRFRLARDQGLGVDGPAGSGEVEDYRVVIESSGTDLRIGGIRFVEGDVELTWTGNAVLESAPSLDGPWTRVVGAVSPFRVAAGDVESRFYRIVD